MAGYAKTQSPTTERDVNQKTGKELLMEQYDRLEQLADKKDEKLKGKKSCKCYCLDFLQESIYPNAVSKFIVREVLKRRSHRLTSKYSTGTATQSCSPSMRRAKFPKGNFLYILFNGTKAY